MVGSLKLYVIASRGFAARLRLCSMFTDYQPSAKHERESIRRDMTDFCKGQGNSAPIPESLFCSLTRLCRNIKVDSIVISSTGNAPPDEESDEEAMWTTIKEHLAIQGEQPVDFERYKEKIYQFLWCYGQREPVVPKTSVPASTNSISTPQASNTPPAPAPMPEPSDEEVSVAPTPPRNMTIRALLGYED